MAASIQPAAEAPMLHKYVLDSPAPYGIIMESQLSAIRHELGQIHEYDFVEGTISSPLAPELHGFFPPDDTYFNYFHNDSAPSILKALEDLSNFLEREGPYDGIIGFSQGGCLAATFIIHHLQKHPNKPLPFKCAIFLSSITPADPNDLKKGMIRFLQPETCGKPLVRGLATTHIWGRNDDQWPGMSEPLYELCDAHQRNFFLHDEGHTIPAARAKDAILGCVKVIRRTLDRAALGA
ncbi:hypothetical protein PISL3812_01118 [Talaromyces islandicus]|uniref:Serine hydrolase domain-containing protein n=1 Tax=Talaromyces islandicus TaxID=28573 RepID=A0A0U1LLS3_TALIS|nr:hypothetical protein PISL3812_01118 [Talaromyces islandicus]